MHEAYCSISPRDLNTFFGAFQVSLALSIFRGFPLRKLPVFVLSQVLGGFTGALISFCLYHRAIVIFENGQLTTPGTSGLFTTFPLDYVSSGEGFSQLCLGLDLLSHLRSSPSFVLLQRGIRHRVAAFVLFGV